LPKKAATGCQKNRAVAAKHRSSRQKTRSSSREVVGKTEVEVVDNSSREVGRNCTRTAALALAATERKKARTLVYKCREQDSENEFNSQPEIPNQMTRRKLKLQRLIND